MYNMRMAFVFSYILWHYTRGIASLFKLYKNLILAVLHTFSIGELFKTLFSPWQLLGEKYKGGLFNFAENFEAFIVNTLMRIVGFFVRGFVIIFGIAVTLVLIVFEAALFVLYLGAPVIVFLLFVSMIKNILEAIR